jgi:hypothetical protein
MSGEQVLTENALSLLQCPISVDNFQCKPHPLYCLPYLTAQDGACFTDEYMMGYYKVSVVRSFGQWTVTTVTVVLGAGYWTAICEPILDLFGP